ncbi:MAG: sulfotransferase [Promethearchaeota archaeon]
MIKTKLQFWITHEKINEWLKDKKIFFILTIGRSGTLFLSHLLNKSENALVVHEKVRSDFRAYKEAFYSEKDAYKYINKFRKREIYIRNVNENIEIYGEVNSVLRRHCNAIKKSFPNAIIFHLIRDGRDVVRSMMSRQTMTNKDKNTKNIAPKKESSWYGIWEEMNRFQRLCWYWDIENRYLNKNVDLLIKFEDILSNYEYFKDKVLDIIGLDIPKEIWQNELNFPKNITPDYKFPHWNDWDHNYRKSFIQICGQTMSVNGYELNF